MATGPLLGHPLQLFGRIASSGDGGVRVLKLTRDPNEVSEKHGLLVDDAPSADLNGFGAVFSGAGAGPGFVELTPEFHYLGAGDIVRYDPQTGEIQSIFRSASPFNHLFVTERCNSKCLMCSQPPRRVDDGFRVDDLLTAIPMIPRDTPNLGFTGGEITLLHGRFVELMSACAKYLPETHIQVLTNGRLLAYHQYVERLADCRPPKLILCVPLYSDIDSEHDFVVQAKGAFDQTIRGLLNLARYEIPVEIRVVIHRQTYRRLPQVAEFITRNLPFAAHVALMGMEMTGYTRANLEALWIDPVEYVPELEEAVEILDAARMNVSIFNHQLCLLPRELWAFSRQSISDWKNVYVPECEGCAERGNCGGFFASAGVRYSGHVKAIGAAS